MASVWLGHPPPTNWKTPFLPRNLLGLTRYLAVASYGSCCSSPSLLPSPIPQDSHPHCLFPLPRIPRAPPFSSQGIWIPQACTCPGNGVAHQRMLAPSLLIWGCQGKDALLFLQGMTKDAYSCWPIASHYLGPCKLPALWRNPHRKRQRAKMERNQCLGHISELLLDQTLPDQTMLGCSYVSQWIPFVV